MVDFDLNASLLTELGVKVFAASVDSGEETKTLVDGLRLSYVTVGHGLDAAAVAQATGAKMQSGDRTFLHATGFLLDPDGKVNTSVYSSGPIGRFTANDVMKKVRFELNRAT